MPFNSLPYELRSYIWSLAVEPRRITKVRIVRSKGSFTKKQHQQGKDILYETTSTPPPAVMHVCHESRKHAPYQRAFTAGTKALARWTWVNFELDIFCVSSLYHIHDISHQSEVQRLEIRTHDDRDWYDSATIYGTLRILNKFVNLREIRIILEPGDLMWAHVFSEWDPFGHCPRENISFVDEGSGLVLTGPQLKLVDDWRVVFSFDARGFQADSLSEAIEFALDDSWHFTLAQMHEVD